MRCRSQHGSTHQCWKCPSKHDAGHNRHAVPTLGSFFSQFASRAILAAHWYWYSGRRFYRLATYWLATYCWLATYYWLAKERFVLRAVSKPRPTLCLDSNRLFPNRLLKSLFCRASIRGARTQWAVVLRTKSQWHAGDYVLRRTGVALRRTGVALRRTGVER